MGQRGCMPWKQKWKHEFWCMGLQGKPNAFISSQGGVGAKNDVRQQFLIGLGWTKPIQKQPNGGDLDLANGQPILNDLYTCSLMAILRPPAPDLHRRPPRQKSLPAAVATRNENWSYLYLCLHLLIMNPSSNSPKF